MTQTPTPRDTSLGGTDEATSADQAHVGTDGPPTVFGNPEGPTASATAAPVLDLTRKAVRQFTVSEVLTIAKRQHRVARVCLRADLQGRFDAIMAELSTLVSAQGVVLENVVDTSLGGTSAAERAQALSDEATQVRLEMLQFMWEVEFEAMADDEWPVWHKANYPGGESPDLREYNNKLIAKCAVRPTFTGPEEVQALRGVLGTPQMIELANKAYEVNAQGGTDIPKSPLSLRNLGASR